MNKDIEQRIQEHNQNPSKIYNEILDDLPKQVENKVISEEEALIYEAILKSDVEI